MSMRRRGRALTLAETLVVVLIVAVIAAISVPLVAALIDRVHDRVATVELLGVHRQAAAQATAEERDLVRDDLRYATARSAEAAGLPDFAPGQPAGAPLRLLADPNASSEQRGHVAGAVAGADEELELASHARVRAEDARVAGLAQRSDSGRCVLAASTRSQTVATWLVEAPEGGCTASVAVEQWADGEGDGGADGSPATGPATPTPSAWLGAELDCDAGFCWASFESPDVDAGDEVDWEFYHGDTADGAPVADGTAEFVLPDGKDTPVAVTGALPANDAGDGVNLARGEIEVDGRRASAEATAADDDLLVAQPVGEPQLQVVNDGALLDLDSGDVGDADAAAVAVVRLDDGDLDDVERTVELYAFAHADQAGDGGDPPAPSTSGDPVAQTQVTPADDGWAVVFDLADVGAHRGFFSSYLARVEGQDGAFATSEVAATYSTAFPWETEDGDALDHRDLDAPISGTVVDAPTGRPAYHGVRSQPAVSTDDDGACPGATEAFEMPDGRVACAFADNFFYAFAEPGLDRSSPRTAPGAAGPLRMPADRSQALDGVELPPLSVDDHFDRVGALDGSVPTSGAGVWQDAGGAWDVAGGSATADDDGAAFIDIRARDHTATMSLAGGSQAGGDAVYARASLTEQAWLRAVHEHEREEFTEQRERTRSTYSQTQQRTRTQGVETSWSSWYYDRTDTYEVRSDNPSLCNDSGGGSSQNWWWRRSRSSHSDPELDWCTAHRYERYEVYSGSGWSSWSSWSDTSQCASGCYQYHSSGVCTAQRDCRSVTRYTSWSSWSDWAETGSCSPSGTSGTVNRECRDVDRSHQHVVVQRRDDGGVAELDRVLLAEDDETPPSVVEIAVDGDDATVSVDGQEQATVDASGLEGTAVGIGRGGSDRDASGVTRLRGEPEVE